MKIIWLLSLLFLTVEISPLYADDDNIYSREKQPYDIDRTYVCAGDTFKAFGGYDKTKRQPHHDLNKVRILFTVNGQAAVELHDHLLNDIEVFFLDIVTDNDQVLWIEASESILPVGVRIVIKLYKDRFKDNLVWSIKHNDAEIILIFSCRVSGKIK